MRFGQLELGSHHPKIPVHVLIQFANVGLHLFEHCVYMFGQFVLFELYYLPANGLSIVDISEYIVLDDFQHSLQCRNPL